MSEKRDTWLAKAKRILAAIVFPVAKNRAGQCVNCGACCRLPKKCIFVKVRPDNTAYCSIYSMRFPACRKYPRTESEWITERDCGFRFKH